MERCNWRSGLKQLAMRKHAIPFASIVEPFESKTAVDSWWYAEQRGLAPIPTENGGGTGRFSRSHLWRMDYAAAWYEWEPSWANAILILVSPVRAMRCQTL